MIPNISESGKKLWTRKVGNDTAPYQTEVFNSYNRSMYEKYHTDTSAVWNHTLDPDSLSRNIQQNIIALQDNMIHCSCESGTPC